MNKLATISLVTVLGVAGGGAYMVMNSDGDLDLAQYIPEPVTGLMNEYIPEEYKPAFLTQNSVVDVVDVEETEIEEVVQEQVVAPQQDESVVLQDGLEQDNQENNAEQAQEAAEEVVANSIEEVSDEQNIMNVSLEEIQDALGKVLTEQSVEPVEAAATVEKEVSSNPKAAKIEKKIDGINAEITKLDSENEQLKDRFQQILKKNRELAEQLKVIDEQLAATN